MKLGKIDETGRLEKEYHFTYGISESKGYPGSFSWQTAAIAELSEVFARRRGLRSVYQPCSDSRSLYDLDPASACAIGMIPPELQTRITSIGVTGEGACMAAVNREQFGAVLDSAQKAQFVELALDMGFQEIYVEEMEFPGESEHEWASQNNGNHRQRQPVFPIQEKSVWIR